MGRRATDRQTRVQWGHRHLFKVSMNGAHCSVACERITGHGARGTGHGARGTGHGARGTGHGAWGMGHATRDTGHGIWDTWIDPWGMTGV